MGVNRVRGSKDDVNSNVYDTAEITVTATGEVLMQTANANTNRQWIYVKNLGPGKIKVGPQTKPKDTLFKNQGKYFNHSSDLQIYAESEDGNAATAFVEESG